jgi:tetratricopeptide (TPR) repeat protein
VSDFTAITDGEEEVLFSLGTIWRIEAVNMNENPCKIELTSCDEFDSQIIELHKKYTEKGCNLSAVGDILYELGNDDEAEWFYHRMLEQDYSLDNKSRGSLYYKIGKMRINKGDYFVALENLRKAASLLASSINESDEIIPYRPLYEYENKSPLLSIYNNMGIIFQRSGKYDEAVEHYQKALEVNGTNSEVAMVHNNLGSLYYQSGNYAAAHEHHLKAVQLVSDDHLYSTKFRLNFETTNVHLQHVLNKPKDENQVTSVNELTRHSDPDECYQCVTYFEFIFQKFINHIK